MTTLPKFKLRIWREQVLWASKDLIVEAPNLEAAVTLLQDMMDRAETTGEPQEHDSISAAHQYECDDVPDLDPNEIATGDTGITLLTEAGERERDLISIPTGCAQLGEFIDLDNGEG